MSVAFHKNPIKRPQWNKVKGEESNIWQVWLSEAVFSHPPDSRHRTALCSWVLTLKNLCGDFVWLRLLTGSRLFLKRLFTRCVLVHRREEKKKKKTQEVFFFFFIIYNKQPDWIILDCLSNLVADLGCSFHCAAKIEKKTKNKTETKPSSQFCTAPHYKKQQLLSVDSFFYYERNNCLSFLFGFYCTQMNQRLISFSFGHSWKPAWW